MPRTNYRKVMKRTRVNEIGKVFRTCRICKIEKPIEEFYENLRYHRGYTHECKECMSSYWKKRNTIDVNRRNFLRTKYGLKVEEYDQIYEEQGGKCKICDEHFERLAVDHNHDTGRVRGLLCDKCNIGIGALKDNPHLTEAATNYLLEDLFKNGKK